MSKTPETIVEKRKITRRLMTGLIAIGFLSSACNSILEQPSENKMIPDEANPIVTPAPIREALPVAAPYYINGIKNN